jgi:hypothetical protein
MIWFGNLNRILATPVPYGFGAAAESSRMQFALERVAEHAPGLSGATLIEALVGTGWVDRPTAERLLPHFRHFDPDRHFGEHLRRLSFAGRSAAEEFRGRVRYILEEIVGTARLGQVGPEPCVRFGAGELEGLVIAQPEVSFTISGRTREAVEAAIEEMPDVLVVVARNFEKGAADQLRGILDRTGIAGTLVTVNLLLGLRATTLRYQPRLHRVLDVLATGGSLRSVDIARLGDREPQVAAA